MKLDIMVKWLFSISFVLSVVLSFLSCNHGFYRKLDSQCKEFVKTIPQIWHQKEGYSIFNADSNQDITEFVEGVNSCLSGISTKEFISIFGEPNIKEVNLYTYFMTEICLSRKRDCSVQEFVISSDTLVNTSIIRPARGIY